MGDEDLRKFEQEAEKALKEIGGEVPLSEPKVLSGRVGELLLANAAKHGEVTYTDGGQSYSVQYSFAEIKMDDGNLGVYEEIPEGLEPKDAETITYLVSGLHFNEPAEVQFSSGKLMLNGARMHKHVVSFQRAVLNKGIF